MAPVTHIEIYGNQLKVYYDDGSTDLAIPTQGSIFLISGTGGTPPDPGDGRFMFPFSTDLILPGNGYMTPERPTHEGVDFTGGAAAHGNPIPCAGNGVVAEHNPTHSGWGNVVRVTHVVPGHGTVSTLYAHMVSDSVIVNVGDPISKGDIIGQVNNTGSSFGSHLHFETWEGTVYGTHRDPITAIPEWNAAT